MTWIIRVGATGSNLRPSAPKALKIFCKRFVRIIDRENKVELRKLSEAVESLEHGGSFDLIDI